MQENNLKPCDSITWWVEVNQEWVRVFTEGASSLNIGNLSLGIKIEIGARFPR